MQIRLIISMIVWHFDAKLAESGQGEPSYRDAFVALRGPLPIRVVAIKRDGPTGDENRTSQQ